MDILIECFKNPAFQFKIYFQNKIQVGKEFWFEVGVLGSFDQY